MPALPSNQKELAGHLLSRDNTSTMFWQMRVKGKQQQDRGNIATRTDIFQFHPSE